MIHKLVFCCLIGVLFSCSNKMVYFQEQLKTTNPSKLTNFSFQPRGGYLLVQTTFENQAIYCLYMLNTSTYKFSTKMDSVIESGAIDRLSLTTKLDETIREYKHSKAAVVKGTNSVVRLYYGKREVFVYFDQTYDSAKIAQFFKKEKYQQVDSFYYCRAKYHLKLVY